MVLRWLVFVVGVVLLTLSAMAIHSIPTNTSVAYGADHLLCEVTCIEIVSRGAGEFVGTTEWTLVIVFAAGKKVFAQ